MEERAAIVVVPQDVKPNEGVFAIIGPGEYELAGFSIYAVPANISGSFGAAVKIHVENMNVLWLPALPTRPLSDKEFDDIGEIDIFLLPLNQEKNGKYISPDAATAVSLMNAVEPKLTIPFAREEKTMRDFFEEAGVKNAETLDKFSIRKKDLPEELQIIHLKV